MENNTNNYYAVESFNDESVTITRNGKAEQIPMDNVEFVCFGLYCKVLNE